MTCIVGMSHGGRVFMGGDSAGVDTSSYGLQSREDAKIFQRGAYLIGFSDSFRMGQILRYAGKLPDPPDGCDDLHAFMCTSFIDEVRETFTRYGFGLKNDEAGHAMGGTFLVATQGNLFVVYSDYQVAMPACGYSAIGCGGDIALGALYATVTSETVYEPVDAIHLALQASEKFSAGVRAPFLIKELDQTTAIVKER